MALLLTYKKPLARITQTLEKAVTDAFILALQGEMGDSLVVTAAENFESIALPACFVKATRQRESIIGSAIYQFEVSVSLLVQVDDSTPQDLESLWAQVLCVTHDVFTLAEKINSIRPQYAKVFGILRDGPVSMTTAERYFERNVTITVHAGLLGS